MDLKECFQEIGGNYDDLVTRLGGSEMLAKKFAMKFLNDPSYQQFMEAIQAENNEEAFRAIHTLKGVSSNLSLTALQQISSVLCEELRNGGSIHDKEDVEKLTQCYKKCVAGLNKVNE